MSAALSHSLADYTASERRSIDELDAAIGRLVRQMNAECYQMLVLVREFDDRFGWKKWGHKTCAEWLAYRSGIGQSAAREKMRTAHALRSLPGISASGPVNGCQGRPPVLVQQPAALKTTCPSTRGRTARYCPVRYE